MADDLPTEYDAIILGTGLPESVIAAALARVGKSVLHLDRNEYYSSDWATFTFDGLLEWIKTNELNEVPQSEATPDITDSTSKDNENVFPLPMTSDMVRNIVTKSYFRTERKEIESVPERSIQDGEDETKDDSMDVKETQNNDPQEQDSPTCNDLESGISEENADESSSFSAPKPNDSSKAMSEAGQEDAKIATTESAASEGETAAASAVTAETLPMPTAKKITNSKPAVNKDMTYQDFEKYFRQFNIDITPKMLFSRGPLVEAIISANISHYAEFKMVNRILTYLNGKIEDVPCSRSDVFSSKLISAIEKRTLMKLLTFCIDFESHEDEYKEYVDKPFISFLQSRRLSPNLQHFVLHSIAMLSQDADTLTGLKTTRSFLHSLGRYGNTPFIWPLYGIGELPQAFCRMCAVFGGLYCLRRSAESITVDATTNACIGIASEGQFLKCKWLIIGNSYLPIKWSGGTTKYVSRAVFITDKSLKASVQGAVTLMSMPRTSEQGSPITVVELDKTSAACPSGLNVVHMVTDHCVSAEEDLKSTAEELLYFPQTDDDRESSKPVVLWSLYFNHAASHENDNTASTLPGNVYCTVLPGSTLGFSHAMNQAKEIFRSICGDDEEFLPAIPNPEDIIMDDAPAEDEGNHAGLVGGSGHDSDSNPPNPQSEEEAVADNEGDGSSN